MTTTALKTRGITTVSAHTAAVGKRRTVATFPARLRHSVYVVAFSFICASLLGGTGFAQPEPHVLTVAPSVRELSVAPGESIDTRLTVANQGSRSFEYTLKLSPYSVTNESYEAVFTPIEGRLPVQSWFELGVPTSGDLAVGGYVDVPMTLRVPVGTPPGGYAAALMVESSQPNDDQGVAIRNRIAHIMYITVEGPVERSGSVGARGLALLGFNRELSFGLVASNTGGTNERIKSQVSIHDVWGDLLFSDQRERFTLPATSRTLEFDWTAPEKMIGIYRVAYEWEFAGGSESATRWAVVVSPWFVLIISTMVLLTIASTITRSWRRRRHR